MDVERKITESIKEIHLKRKRANTDTIVTYTPEIEPDTIKSVLESLIEKKVIYVVNKGSGNSYRFCKDKGVDVDVENVGENFELGENNEKLSPE